jgi:DNA ligase 1
MSDLFKPTLAISHTAIDFANLDFSKYVMMPKLDGIRAITKDGVLYSRTGKPIRNKFIQHNFSALPSGLDGELYIHGVPFHELSSAVMSTSSIEGAKVEYHAFDDISNTERRLSLRFRSWITEVEFHSAGTLERVESFEDYCVSLGYEGIMLKLFHAPYSHGRSGKVNPALIKVKRVETAEMIITGVEPLRHNMNEKAQDAFGKCSRSQAKVGKEVDSSMVGALLGISVDTGATMKIGSGFTQSQRLEMMVSWCNGTLCDKVVEFKHYPGGKDKPRQPIFLRFREDLHENT